jgi:hypothetical protein
MTAPDDSSKENILASLRVYHRGTVYLMGSPGTVSAGFARNEKELKMYTRDWLKFYDNEAAANAGR